MLRRFAALCVVTCFIGAASTGAAAPRDRAARQKINDALDLHFRQQSGRAEAMLRAIVEACGERCSARVLADAWMYIGVVRGGGLGDAQGAREAFLTAVTLDPAVELDADLATEETSHAWQQVAQPPAAPGKAELQSQGGPNGLESPTQEPTGSISCSLEVREVEVRRPIPIACSTDEDVERMELGYRAPGEAWRKLSMKKRGSDFVAEVPCQSTAAPGSLRLHATARADGDITDRWGSRKQPIEVALVASSDEDPPALPGVRAPRRCADANDCPPGFPDCPCQGASDCEAGYVCRSERCTKDPGCTADAECASGSCLSGECTPEKPTRLWLGLEVAQDFAFVTGSQVCARQGGDERFSCFDESGAEHQGALQAGFAGGIDAGFAPATTRLLAVLELAVSKKLSLGARAGIALGGKPSAEGNAFFLPHLEARATYWFAGVPAPRRRFLPFLFVGGGAAQVDASMPVEVRDCGLGLTTDPPSTSYAPDSNVYSACIDPTQPHPLHRKRSLEATLRIGRQFLTGGAGVFHPLGRFALRAEGQALVMLPASGVVLQPSLGLLYGF